jgi:ABC-2 type transport system ATP-binding protein
MELAIETHQLTKSFEATPGWQGKAHRRPIKAVAGVDLAVEAGELFGLLGPNGAGKTTLVKILSTLILPSEGSALVAGHRLSQAGAIRARVGLVVSDERSFYWRLSARRNLEFFAAMHGLHGRQAGERVNAVLAQVELQAEAQRRYSDLSGGMRQRVAIARSLLHRPQILFLDEPSRSLDPTAAQHLHDLLQTLMGQQMMTIFLITHDLREAEKLCRRVALMHRGKINAIGRPAELRRRLSPQRDYLLFMEKVDPLLLDPLRRVIPTLQYQESDQGGQLGFQANEEDDTLSKVLDYLLQQRLRVKSIEAAPPSLDEVFAHFTHDAQEQEPSG